MCRQCVTYHLLEGESLDIEHCGETITLEKDVPLRRDFAAPGGEEQVS
jgi:hypothetical protein